MAATPAPASVSASKNHHDKFRRIFTDLVDTMGYKNLQELAILQPVTSMSHKRSGSIPITLPPVNPAPTSASPSRSFVSDEERAKLEAGEAVRKTVDGQSVLLTPNGDILRNLTPREEERFLALQKRLAERAAGGLEPWVYSRKPNAVPASSSPGVANAGGFSLVHGRAVPNGPNACFPLPENYSSEGVSEIDPVARIQRQEAVAYLNQYIMPQLSVGLANAMPPALAAANDGTLTQQGTTEMGTQLKAYLRLFEPYLALNPSSSDVIPDGDEVSFAELADNGGATTTTTTTTKNNKNSGGQRVDVEVATTIPLTTAVPLLTPEAAAAALEASRKETEKVGRSVNALVQRSISAVKGSAGNVAAGATALGPMMR